MNKILLVEDNEAITMGLEFLLTEEGYLFESASGAKEARRRMEKERFDLILLDIALPDGDGYQLCKEIRDRQAAPVIFLTARDEEKDVVLGFDLGADDYVIKPFRNRELLSRIANVLRRCGKAKELRYRNISIDLDAGKVYQGGRELNLTRLEYRILAVFFANPKKLFTRDEILNAIWDSEGNFVNDNTLTVTIKRLREKLGDKDAEMIETVRGMGYRLGREE